jgi:predicted transcriptional regulator
MPRTSWLDSDSEEPQFAEYVQRLETFTDALADGVIDEGEMQAQEDRLIESLKEVEPHLDDELHEKVTRLLCELTAYDIMKSLRELQKAAVASVVGG